MKSAISRPTGGSALLTNEAAPKLTVVDRQMLQNVKDGFSWFDIPGRAGGRINLTHDRLIKRGLLGPGRVDITDAGLAALGGAKGISGSD